jgi:hypothetical protein
MLRRGLIALAATALLLPAVAARAQTGWVVYETDLGPNAVKAGRITGPQKGRWYVWDRTGHVYGYVSRAPSGRWLVYQAGIASSWFKVSFVTAGDDGNWHMYDPTSTIDGRPIEVGYVSPSSTGWEITIGYGEAGRVGPVPGGVAGGAAFLLFVPH